MDADGTHWTGTADEIPAAADDSALSSEATAARAGENAATAGEPPSEVDLTAALREVLLHAKEPLSTRALGRAVDRPQSSLMQRYGSKRALLEAALAVGDDGLERCLARSDPADADARLASLLAQAADVLRPWLRDRCRLARARQLAGLSTERTLGGLESFERSLQIQVLRGGLRSGALPLDGPAVVRVFVQALVGEAWRASLAADASEPRADGARPPDDALATVISVLAAAGRTESLDAEASDAEAGA